MISHEIYLDMRNDQGLLAIDMKNHEKSCKRCVGAYICADMYILTDLFALISEKLDNPWNFTTD